jgi:hypothetical protein
MGTIYLPKADHRTAGAATEASESKDVIFTYLVEDYFGVRVSIPGNANWTPWVAFPSLVLARNYLMETYADNIEDDETYFLFEEMVAEQYRKAEKA